MQLPNEIVLDGIFEGEGAAPRPRRGRKLVWVGKGALAIMDQGLLSGSTFLISILLARWLSRGEYGAYALGFSLFLLLSGFHNAFFLEPMSVFGPGSHSKCLTSYVKKLLELHFLLALLLSMVAGAGVILLRFVTADRAMTSAMWGVAIAVPLVQFHWLCRRAVYLKLAPGLAVAGSAIYCLALILLMLVFEKLRWLSPFTGFLIQSLAAVPAALLLLRSLKSGSDLRPGPSHVDILRQHWRYGRWVAGGTIVHWLSGNAYYVIIGALLPMQALGAFRALQNFCSPFNQFLTAITLLVLPWASSKFAEEGGPGLQRRIRQLTRLFGGGALAYFTAILLFGNRVMSFVYAGHYNEFSHLLPLATVPVLLGAASVGSEVAAQVMQAPSEVFLAYAISAAFTLLAGVALTHYWGLVGGLFGILVSSVAFWVVMTYRSDKRLRKDALGRAKRPRDLSGDNRVAWLMPDVVGGYYMQPIFKEFTALMPNTVVFTGAWPGTLPQYRGKFEIRHVRGVRFITLRRGGASSSKRLMLAPPTILWQLIRFRPKIVLTGAFNLWSAYALLLKRLMKWRVVLIWDGVSPAVACLDSPFRLALRRRMVNRFDAAICNTRTGVKYLQDVLGMPSDRTVHYPYQVADASALGGGNKSIPQLQADSSFVFLAVGRLVEPKGIRRLLEAAELLLDRGLNNFTIRIAGTGELAERLQKHVANSRLGKVVRWLGFVSYEKLGACYQASDALILPSFEDVWGMVVLEAMCFGKPVLCSKYAGAKEMIREGVNGFVIDPHNPQELADRMELFIRRPGLAKRFGEKSKEIINPYTTRRSAEVLAGVATGCLQDISKAEFQMTGGPSGDMTASPWQPKARGSGQEDMGRERGLDSN